MQAIIATEARDVERWIYATAIDMESDLIDRLDQRMKVTHIDAEAFKEAGRPVYGEFIRTVRGGAKMIETRRNARRGDRIAQSREVSGGRRPSRDMRAGSAALEAIAAPLPRRPISLAAHLLALSFGRVTTPLAGGFDGLYR